MKLARNPIKMLFVCNAGKNRSRTAAELWKNAYPLDEVKFAGIAFLEKPDLFHWADKIVCFEKKIKKRVLEMVFDDIKIFLKLEVWEIPDIYNYGNKELEKAIKSKIEKK